MLTALLKRFSAPKTHSLQDSGSEEPAEPLPVPEEHRIYTGHRQRGPGLTLWGKCLCGAILENAFEIEEHKKLIV